MIRVLNNYGGLPSGGRRILPGDYAPDDPALFGLADYLLEQGHAVELTEASDETPVLETAVPEEPEAPKTRRRRGAKK